MDEHANRKEKNKTGHLIDREKNVTTDTPSTEPKPSKKRGKAKGLPWGDALMGLAIRACGYSAIFFVFCIFFFVFREAAPLLFRNNQQWYQWTASADGEASFSIHYNADHAWLELRAFDADGKLLAKSERQEPEPPEQSVPSEESKPAEQDQPEHPDQTVVFPVQKDRLYYVEILGHGRDVSAVYHLKVDGPGDIEGEYVYPDEARSRAKAWDLGRGDLDMEELELLGRLSLFNFFTSSDWNPVGEPPQHGILALLAGTVSVTILAMLLAVPFGLGAAVYVSEFCAGKTRETLKIVIELLAAIPSIVWGFIAVVVINPLIIWTTGAPIGVCVLNGGIILALMSVPIIVSVGEDSLKAVPASYREAAIALGASRWQVVYKVLFPAAKNGLLAAVLLGVGRAVGETMAVLMATGHSRQIPDSIFSPVQTLTATIAAELGEAPAGGDHYRVLFLIGVVLFVITFFVNLTADMIVKGIRGQKAS